MLGRVRSRRQALPGVNFAVLVDRSRAWEQLAIPPAPQGGPAGVIACSSYGLGRMRAGACWNALSILPRSVSSSMGYR